MLRFLKYPFSISRNLQGFGRIQQRNSQTIGFSVRFIASQKKPIDLHIPKNGTIGDIIKYFNQTKQKSEVQFLCSDYNIIPEFTPIDALLSRHCFLTIDNQIMVRIQGQLQENLIVEKPQEVLESLDLPSVIQQELQDYIKRVQLMCLLKFQTRQQQKTFDIKASEAKKILIECLLDPKPNERSIYAIQKSWARLYGEIQNMKAIKLKAQIQCRKKVKQIMSFGLMGIGANIGFIWSGTYIFYSWDIIEPIAYFIDAGAGLALLYQFFKIGKLFSYNNYYEYLFKKNIQKFYKNLEFSPTDFQQMQEQLKQMQAIIKDYYLRKL